MNLELEDLELLIRELVLLRKQVSALSGATAGLLTAIDRAGGWHVFDPQHQDPVARAFMAVRTSLDDMLATRFDLPPLPLGETSMVYE
jgi:hypothetical protein